MGTATDNRLSALGPGVFDMAGNLLKSLSINQRVDGNAVFGTIADFHGGHLFGQCLAECIIDARLHKNPVGTNTSLPGIAEFRGEISRTATSISASSKMIRGALPPSSSPIFLMVSRLPHQYPADFGGTGKGHLADDVIVGHFSADIAGICAANDIDHACGNAGPVCQFSKGKGRKRRLCGGPSTTVQPAAMAGATLRVIIALGKFHGVIAATTPIGCFSTIRRLSVICGCRTSPVMRRPSSANQSINEAL